MSGHSKWAQIKRQKGATDQKKGLAFSKLSREISLAAKNGDDPQTNYRLRMALDRAKDSGMPKDAIERAMKRGTGEMAGKPIEEAIYEGYGPFGTAFLIETATDNTNRTSNEIKRIFSKHQGNLGAQGSVAWQFVTRGQILVPYQEGVDLEAAELLAIDHGAADVRASKEGLEIYCSPMDLQKIKNGLLDKNYVVVQAHIIKESTLGVELSDSQKTIIAALFAELEDHDDVIAVHTNANL